MTDKAEEIASLKQQLAEAKKDAERYRFLKSKEEFYITTNKNGLWWRNYVNDTTCDEAIDQAMREGSDGKR